MFYQAENQDTMVIAGALTHINETLAYLPNVNNGGYTCVLPAMTTLWKQSIVKGVLSSLL